ncbi:hypothetical protein TNCV_5062851 [Trichonephila clavipes]|nr:hypothetical protein TNCV_5062851 [Trichonephila clavipes]
MPVATVWKVLRKRLELRHCRLQLLQALMPTVYGLRGKFADDMLMLPMKILWIISYSVRNQCFTSVDRDYVDVPPLPADLPDLRHRIEATFARITDTPNKVWDELTYRFGVCCVMNGAHNKHL